MKDWKIVSYLKTKYETHTHPPSIFAVCLHSILFTVSLLATLVIFFLKHISVWREPLELLYHNPSPSCDMIDSALNPPCSKEKRV